MPRSMMRLLPALALVVCFSVAFAGHDPNKDVHVNVNTGVGKKVTDALPIAAVGTALYKVQEGAQNTVSKATGTSVDHYYVWIGVNGQSVPVDPFCANR